MFVLWHGIKPKSSVNVLVKGESAEARRNRIRQFEDFFNVSGLGTPDDLVEFREQQKGFQARLERWSDISRGCQSWEYGTTKNSQDLGIQPVITGREFTLKDSM